jgi:2-polyprenyl-3-methyl-5-hydroxy-6-metoxy-1,4-benzoquinol methylase
MTNSEDVIRVSSCPVCGMDDHVALPLPGRWIGREIFEPHRSALGLARCACGLVFVNPRPSARLLAEFYGGRSYECHRADANGTSDDRARFMLGRLQHHAPRAVRLLDYGCGGGFLLRHARELGLDAVGFDIGAQAQRVCKGQGLKVVGDPSELEPASFDAIVLHHVFEHVPDPRRTLHELSRLLAPGGMLFLEVPNAGSLRAQLAMPSLTRRLRLDERYRAFPIHLWYFRPSTLGRLLGATGYHVKALETYGIGLDELIFHEGWSSQDRADRVIARRRMLPNSLRSLTKRWLYRAALGENLLAVARPAAYAAASVPNRSAA